MNKKILFGNLLIFMAFQGVLFNSIVFCWPKFIDDAVDYVEQKYEDTRGAAEKAGHAIGEVAADGLTIVSAAGEWVLTEAGKLANAVGCMAKAGVSVSGDIIKSLAGATISFDEISVEGTLGGATFGVKARGKIMQKSFNLSSSIGKDGFSQDGFKQLFYEPLAKLF
jgi:hypothetical protein